MGRRLRERTETRLLEVIYLAGLTRNLSHLIFPDVAYQSEEVLIIYDYDLEDFREKKSMYTHSVTVRGPLRPLSRYPTSDNESPR